MTFATIVPSLVFVSSIGAFVVVDDGTVVVNCEPRLPFRGAPLESVGDQPRANVATLSVVLT